MSVGKSKAVPKAFWLALLLLGMTIARDDFRRLRAMRAEPVRAGFKTAPTRLTAPQTLAAITSYQNSATLHR